MEHLAIDLGSRKSQICLRRADQTVLDERKVETDHLEAYFRRLAPSRVILETSAESFRIADQARAAGHEVRVVPATLVRTLGVGSRRTKNDRKDAQVLSEVSCRIDLPSVHIPSSESRERKTICGMREAQVSARTQLINCVRGWLRTQRLRVKAGADGFADRVRLQQTLQCKTEAPDYVESMLCTIEQLDEQIQAAEKRLAKLAKADGTCRLLMTVPGVGPVTAIRFTAAIDDISRFPNAHAVQSYLGLVPGEYQSSETQHRLSITKAGSKRLRWALVQAAWSARNFRPDDPMVAWSIEVEKRRGKAIAVVALARKLAGILFAIWRDGTSYDKQRGAAIPGALPM